MKTYLQKPQEKTPLYSREEEEETQQDLTPQKTKQEYSPFDEYTTHPFKADKDVNIFRLWLNHYKKYISWQDFQDFQDLQDFDINNPKEGQLVKVPNIPVVQEQQKQTIAPKDSLATKKATTQAKLTQGAKSVPKAPKATPPKQITPPITPTTLPAKKDAYAGMDAKRVETGEFKAKKAQEHLKTDKSPKVYLPNPFDTPLDVLMDKPELTPSEIKEARGLIDKLPEKQQGDYYEKLQYKVPYYNQRDSEAYPTIGGGMCNLSSMGMAFSLFGIDNPHPNMQYDDALEKVRLDNQYGDRESIGQMHIANHFGFYFGGIEGNSKKNVDNTYVGNNNQSNLSWWESKILPELRKGNSITVGLWSYETTKTGFPKYGHIVHLIGISKDGLIVHDPYAKANFAGKDYNEVMHSSMNTKEKDSTVGKTVLWKFEDLKNSKAVYIGYLRVLKSKEK